VKAAAPSVPASSSPSKNNRSGSRRIDKERAALGPPFFLFQSQKRPLFVLLLQACCKPRRCN
ncbi:hypothetical protein, partial [Mesorhizobium sp.]|uniref:hypothetical protein n=1 Tax=Mesorhizobium sp. TaxID=1871066 RepID=UPI0025C17D4E